MILGQYMWLTTVEALRHFAEHVAESGDVPEDIAKLYDRDSGDKTLFPRMVSEAIRSVEEQTAMADVEMSKITQRLDKIIMEVEEGRKDVPQDVLTVIEAAWTVLCNVREISLRDGCELEIRED